MSQKTLGVSQLPDHTSFLTGMAVGQAQTASVAWAPPGFSLCGGLAPGILTSEGGFLSFKVQQRAQFLRLMERSLLPATV